MKLMEPKVTIEGHIQGKTYKDAFNGKAKFKVEGVLEGGEVVGEMLWVLQGTQLRIQAIQVLVEIQDGNITSTDYKTAIPFKKLRHALTESLFSNDGRLLNVAALHSDLGAKPSSEEEALWLKEEAERAKEAAKLHPARPKRGPGAKNDEHWAWVASRYEYFSRAGGAPIKRLVQELVEKEEMDLTYEQMKGQVEQATRREFLTRPSGKGHTDRQLGPAYLKYMDQRRKEEEE